MQILALLARRQTNAEIALALTISPNTEKTQLRHIYEKQDVHNRQEAVTRAREMGLLPPKPSGARHEPS